MSYFNESEYHEWILPQLNKRLWPKRGDKTRFARKHGVSAAFVTYVARGDKIAPDWVLEAAEFKRLTGFIDQSVSAA